MQVDERTRAAIDRLTSNERECLRRRLLPQTAKEMAVDLGVSPHAVEKRLKMARAKLGVTSSLVAARLLTAYEGPVPQAPDLTGQASGAEAVLPPRRFSGVFSMPLLLALIAAALPQSSAPLPPGAPRATDGTVLVDGHPVATRKVTPNEASAFLSQGFDAKDADRSGFLDPREASTVEPRDAAMRDQTLAAAPPPGAPDPAAERKWMAKLDTDRDGKVSREEYIAYMLPWTLWQGVPADWPAAR